MQACPKCGKITHFMKFRRHPPNTALSTAFNLASRHWKIASRPKHKQRLVYFYDYHRRHILPSEQERKLQRWSHAQWNVELIVNRSNACGSSLTWSPASPVFGAENMDKTVNVTIRHPVHKYMHIYDQCNFWATILPSMCIVISDLLSVSCVTVARKNLISWCKQRDFFPRRVGARFMSISKPFHQHSGTIFRRSKSYLIVWIFSDTVAENCGQVWLQFVMTACVLPLRPLAMYVATCSTWTGSSHTWQLTGPQDQSSVVEIELTSWILVIVYQQAFIVQLFRQTEAVYTIKSNNKPSHVVMLNCHCQILDMKLHEFWMVKYLATFERWSFGSIICTWKMWDFDLESILLIIQHEITPLFLLMFDMKHTKNIFFE